MLREEGVKKGQKPNFKAERLTFFSVEDEKIEFQMIKRYSKQ